MNRLQKNIGIKVNVQTGGATFKLRQIGKEIDKTTESFQGLNDAAVAGAGAASAALGYLAYRGVQHQSDLVESINAVGSAFGTTFGQQIVEVSQNARKEFGITSAEFNQHAEVLATFLRGAGFQGQELVDATIQAFQRATDIGSVKNKQTVEVLEKLRSGLAREIEPLKQLGVMLDQDTLKAIAYAEGIAEVGEELTESQKSLAIYLSFLEQTDRYHGDFEKTSGEVANAQKILNASWTEAQRVLGEQLYDDFQGMLSVAQGLVDWYIELDDETRNVLSAFALGTAIIPAMTAAAWGLSAAITAIGTASGLALGGLSLFAGVAVAYMHSQADEVYTLGETMHIAMVELGTSLLIFFEHVGESIASIFADIGYGVAKALEKTGNFIAEKVSDLKGWDHMDYEPLTGGRDRLPSEDIATIAERNRQHWRDERDKEIGGINDEAARRLQEAMDAFKGGGVPEPTLTPPTLDLDKRQRGASEKEAAIFGVLSNQLTIMNNTISEIKGDTGIIAAAKEKTMAMVGVIEQEYNKYSGSVGR